MQVVMSVFVKCHGSPSHVGNDPTLQVSLRSASWENAFERNGTLKTPGCPSTRQIHFMIVCDLTASPAHL